MSQARHICLGLVGWQEVSYHMCSSGRIGRITTFSSVEKESVCVKKLVINNGLSFKKTPKVFSFSHLLPNWLQLAQRMLPCQQ